MLTFQEFYAAFSELERIYPRVLPLTLWRAWELAFYRKVSLPEPILDLGCGDGRFFQSIWPQKLLADGVDISLDASKRARQSGVYRDVFHAPAHEIPVTDQMYGAVFSNCALEHMSHIDQVLSEAARILVPGGKFLFSVVTDRLVAWSSLRPLLDALGAPDRGNALWGAYEEFHHLVNPLSKEQWLEKTKNAGFEIFTATPIVPQTFARIFLFFDELWHVKKEKDADEVGNDLHAYLLRLSNYENGMYHILKGLWELEPPAEQADGAGLIVLAVRK